MFFTNYYADPLNEIEDWEGLAERQARKLDTLLINNFEKGEIQLLADLGYIDLGERSKLIPKGYEMRTVKMKKEKRYY